MVHVVSEPRLAESYRTCRRMQRRHDPTYYCATRCLPRDVRPAVHALYGFVRGADEIVDGPTRLPPGAAAPRALDALAGRARARAGRRALRASGHRRAGRRRRRATGCRWTCCGAYMDSMRVDCDEPVRIATRASSTATWTAAPRPSGRIMAPLLGAPAGAEDVARLGVAFQLTNFIRDVREDWALDRVYLPGLPEDDLRARRRQRPRCASASPARSAARGALFAETPARPPAVAPADAPRRAGGARASTRACSTASSATATTCSARGRALRPWEAGAPPRRARGR